MTKQNSSSNIEPLLGNAIDPKTGREIDPVSGMSVLKHAHYRYTFKNKEYKFYNEDCLNDFKANPLKYITGISKTDTDSNLLANTKQNNIEEYQIQNDMHSCCSNNKVETKSCCSENTEKEHTCGCSDKSEA